MVACLKLHKDCVMHRKKSKCHIVLELQTFVLCLAIIKEMNKQILSNLSQKQEVKNSAFMTVTAYNLERVLTVAFLNPTKEQIPAFQILPVLSATRVILRRQIALNILE